MKKPPNLLFGVDDVAPVSVVMLNAVQHVGLIAINLIYPVLILHAIGAPLDVVSSVVALGMTALGLGTFLQALRSAPLGSGYMCPSTFTATYLGPSLIAVKTGGLSLVFGMTMFAGALEAALAPLLQRVRAMFPPEITGLVIFMIGWTAAIAGLRLLIGRDAGEVAMAEWAVAALTAGTMIALSVWGKGIARMLCTLIGLAAGYASAALLGLFDPAAQLRIDAAPWIGFPSLGHIGWSFDLALAAPFAVGALAAAMKAMGTITMCQRINDANWVRPDMRSTTKGVLADGVSTLFAGSLGTFGTNTSTPSVGLSSITGVASRRVAWAIAALMVILGLSPKVGAWLAIMPRSVMAAALLFAMSSVIVNGVQIMNSRLLDARRTLVIALSIVVGTAVDIFPYAVQSAPAIALPVVGSSLVLATALALALNLIFRVGVKSTVSLTVPMAHVDAEEIESFFQSQGAAWGARPDVIGRATFGVVQLLDAVRDTCASGGSAVVRITFDEFNLDVRVSYEGAALAFPDERPSPGQIRESEDGARLMAGFMLRRCADRLRSHEKNGYATLDMHYDH